MSTPPPERNLQLKPIGVVAADTGIDAATLRVWERRYGFPKPSRLGSGHRLYEESDIVRLHKIALALRAGIRAGTALRADSQELERILELNHHKKSARRAHHVHYNFESLLPHIRSLDAAAVRREIGLQLVALGARKFVIDYVAPLADWIGDSWERGELDIHEEHFTTHQLQTVLRSILDQRHEHSGASRVILTTLPGEQHSLGMKMAAVILSFAGASPRLLGPETPLAGIVTAAKAARAGAVGISVSVMSATRGTSQRLCALLEMLPENIQLWVGGKGAAKLKNLPRKIMKIRDSAALEEAARALREK